MNASDELIIEPRSGRAADACVIILHGLGADGRDFESLVPALNLGSKHAVRFILPNAPRMPVTVNGGMVMPAWYDIMEMSLDRRVDEKQLKMSAQRIQALIDEQVEHGIAPERIILAGFSQGGAVAYEAALSYPKRLGGLLAMSTYLATADSLDYAEANRELPIEIHHGLMDPVVFESLGRTARDCLIEKGYPVNYRQYPMAHAVCPQQIMDISRWLDEKLGA